MTDKNQGIGDRYHSQTKYTRSGMLPQERTERDPAGKFADIGDMPRKIFISPIPQTSPVNFWDVLRRRRSHRDFSHEPLSLNDLRLLLFAVQGVTGRIGGYLLRTAPSAGALYPVETYLAVNRVETLAPGIYHLDVEGECLELLRPGFFGRRLASAALNQSMVEDSAVAFIWTAVVDRSKRKYRERAYRYIYMDAGHIGQNLYLAAAALGLGCCTIGAFYDDEVNAVIGVDGISEPVVYMGVIGRLL